YCSHRDLHSFPTRRSSDLVMSSVTLLETTLNSELAESVTPLKPRVPSWSSVLSTVSFEPVSVRVPRRTLGVLLIDAARATLIVVDRKSTRLNSSHSQISYA